MENAEPLQVVKYEPGGYYNEHHDACCDDDSKCDAFIQNGGQRVLTVLIYLNDSFEGGATEFPELKKMIKPPKYGCVIFHPLADNTNQCHPLALHRGMPVTSGTKYICNVWIREGCYKVK
jgi:prolyl 4-hydroxylase